MNRINAILLASLFLTVGIAGMIPTANAGHLPITDPQREIGWQVAFGGSMVGSGSFAYNGNWNLEAGATYVVTYSWGFTGGCSDTSGWNLLQNSNSSAILTVVEGSSGTVNKRGDVAYLDVIQQGISGNNHRYATVTFTSPITGAASLSGFITSCSPSTTGPQNLNFPTGVATANDLLGYQGHYVRGTTVVGVLLKVSALQSEEGILESQTQRSPATKWTWARLNPSTTLFQIAAGNGGNLAEAAQSFTPLVAGSYVETTTVGTFGSGTTNPCTYTLHVGITNTLAYPHNEATERAGVDIPVTSTNPGSSSGTITIDWLTGTVGDDNGAISLGTPTWKIGGTTITASSYNVLPPYLDTGTHYVVVKWTAGSCTGSYLSSRLYTSNTYAGGTAYTVSGGAWVQDPASEIGGFLVNAYGGNTTYEYRLNATFAHTGGAFYTYIAEHEYDSTTGLAEPQSSWGGAPLWGNNLYVLAGGAGSADCNFGGSSRPCLVREYRLGFKEVINSTQTLTITLNTVGTGRNLLYTGTLINQPTVTHMGRVAFDLQTNSGGDLTAYVLLSTDDYKFNVYFGIKKCEAIDGAGLCTTDPNTAATYIPNGSYSGKVRGLRVIAGSWNETGQFSISGQDIGGGTTQITLTKSGYVQETYNIPIPATSGNYFVNLTMLEGSGNLQIDVESSGVSVTFDPASACVASGSGLSMNITRTKPVEMWVGLYKLDSLGNPKLITTLYQWSVAINATILYTYPDGRSFSSGDTGKYVLAATIASQENVAGKTVGYAKIGVNDACDFPLGVSFLTNLNTVAQTEVGTAAVTQAATVEQKEVSTYENYLAALDWGFDAPIFGVPNMVLVLCAFLAFAMVLRFGGGRKEA